MVERIHTLPRDTRRALQLAACIGNRFELRTLALVSEHAPQATAELLWPALQERLIQPLGGGHELAGLRIGQESAADSRYRGLHRAGRDPAAPQRHRQNRPAAGYRSRPLR